MRRDLLAVGLIRNPDEPCLVPRATSYRAERSGVETSRPGWIRRGGDVPLSRCAEGHPGHRRDIAHPYLYRSINLQHGRLVLPNTDWGGGIRQHRIEGTWEDHQTVTGDVRRHTYLPAGNGESGVR